MNNVSIYTLSDPTTNQVKWVGQTSNPKKRLYNHLFDKRKDVYKNWISELMNNGLRPVMDVIDDVPKEEWAFWEMHYISLYRSWGFSLINKSTGGHGSTGIFGRKKSPELLKQMSIHRIGKKRPSWVVDKMKESGMYERKRKDMMENNPMKNPLSRKKMSQTRIRLGFRKLVVIQFDLDRKFIKRWESIKDANEVLGLSGGNISRCANGKGATAYGFIWKFEKDINK
jgi:hypothetical protein